MKKVLAGCFCSILFFACVACDSDSPHPIQTNPPVRDTAHIVFSTQEYIDNNIAEIPYIEYDGDSNPEIDSINKSINQGVNQQYLDFQTSKKTNEWMEIKSYPFTDDNYLQVVVTYATYPTYASAGNIFSINYDMYEKKALSTGDALEKNELTESSLTEIADGLIKAANPDVTGTEIAVTGFLYKTAPADDTQFFMEITLKYDDNDDYSAFYMYTVSTEILTELDPASPFKSTEPDEMDPPLSYQQVSLESFPGLKLTISPWMEGARYESALLPEKFTEDAGYTFNYSIDEMTISFERKISDGSLIDPDAIADHYNKDAYSTPEVHLNEALSTKLSYPAYEVTFTNKNETTVQNIIYVGTDDYDFSISFTTNVDDPEKYSSFISDKIEDIEFID